MRYLFMTKSKTTWHISQHLILNNWDICCKSPLQGFRSHCSVRGYYSLLVATAGADATTKTGRQHTHAHTHTHTQPPTQPFITSKHDMTISQGTKQNNLTHISTFNLKQLRYLFMTKSKTTWHISQHLILNNWDICSWPKAKQPDIQHLILNNWDICSWPKAKQPDTYLNI